MATLRQKPNGFWYVRYRDAEGKQREESTGVHTKLGKAEPDAAKEKQGQIIARVKAEKEAKAAPPPVLVKRTFAEAWAVYEPWLKVYRKEATQVAYKTAIGKYFEPHWREKYVDELTLEEIEDYLAELHQTLSARHCNTLRVNLQGFYRFCVDHNYCTVNIAKAAQKMVEPPLEEKSLNLEHAMLILQELEGQDRAIWATMCLSGVRVGECKGLTRNDFQSTERLLVVNKSVYKRGKTAIDKTGRPFQKAKSGPSVRNIVIPQLLVDLLKEWRDVSRQQHNLYDTMFVNPKNGGVFDEDAFRKSLRAAAKRAAPKVKGSEPLKVEWAQCHTARGCFARIYLSFGGNIRNLQRDLGHSRIETTMRYLRWSKGYAQNAFDLITTDRVGISVGMEYDALRKDLLSGLSN